MRWKKNKNPILPGTERRKTKFALLPTVVEDYVVWLESYIIVQRYIKNRYEKGCWYTKSKHLAVYYP